MRPNLWNVALAGLAASFGFVSVIVAGVELSGEVLVFWRCALAAGTVPLILLVLRRVRSLRVRRYPLRVVGLGLLLALHWVLFFETVKRSSVAVAILTVYTAPIFLAVLAPLILIERRSRIGLVALVISSPGLVLIALAGEQGSRADPLAVVMGIGAAVTYAFIIIGAKTVVAHESTFALPFWQYVVVSFALIPFLFHGERVLPHAGEWPYVVLLGTLLTAVEGILYLTILRHVTAQAAGLLAYLEPVSASFLAWAILGQALGWQVALGGAAVLAGGGLVVLYEGVAETSLESPAV